MTDNPHQTPMFKGRRTAKRLKAASLIALLFMAYGIVGSMDYEDAVAADQHYTEMVCAGRWPDYDARRPDCSTRTATAKGRDI